MEQPKLRPKGTAMVRTSKYRHLFGTLGQNVDSVLGVKLGSTQAEMNIIKANSKYFAVPWGITGCLAVLPVDKKGAVDETPLLVHEENTITDFALNPFRQNIVATACQDGTVQLWEIPEEFSSNLTEPSKKITVSDKRVLLVDFHPLAENILVASDAGKQVKIYDIESAQEKFTLPDVHKGLVSNVSWNVDGSLLATSCKDKTMRIFDPRANSVVGEAQDHQGVKAGRVLWLGRKFPNYLFTCGFAKGSERQYGLFDQRNLSQRLVLQAIDNSSGTLLPFYDDDLGLIYLAGKGDGNIRFYEVVEEDPYIHYLGEFKAKDPQSGIAALPKTACDVMKCEVMKMLKVTPNGSVIPLRFEVPRKENVFFQEDIFPDTFDGKPSMSADEWCSGSNNPGNLKSLNPEKQ